MTTQQDKELSSVIGNLLHAFWMQCRMSEVEFENMPEVKAARSLATSPQLPVAQMGGEPFANSLRKIFTIARNMDDDKVKETFPDHWQIWQDALASHPSNAVPSDHLRDATKKVAATVPQVVQAPDGYMCFGQDGDAFGYSPKSQPMKGLDWEPVYRNAAPQPVAASPSIVPSDEQAWALAQKVAQYQHDKSFVYFNKENAGAFARALLTTASNAGEAAPAAIEVRNAVLPTAEEFSANNKMAVTKDWMMGWNACRSSIAMPASNVRPWGYHLYGSGPEKGYTITYADRLHNNEEIAYIGDGEIAREAVTAICNAHNTSLQSPPQTGKEQS
jgi:hypothetical protein